MTGNSTNAENTQTVDTMDRKDRLEFFTEVVTTVVLGVLALGSAIHLLIERL